MPTILNSPSLVTLAAQAVAEALAAAGGQPGRGECGAALWVGEALLEVVNAQVAARLVAQEEGHLLVRVRGRFRLAAVLGGCASYGRWAGRQGQPPTYQGAQLLWALVAQRLLGLSLRTLEVELRHNLLLRWFCGFALHERTPDHSTLGRFDRWLRSADGGPAGQALFQAVLAQIEEDFPSERSKAQIGDTFAMRARAADTERTHLLRDVCRRLLACLERASPGGHGAVLRELGEQFCLLFGHKAEVRTEQLTSAGRNGHECDAARGAAFCLALVRRQIAQEGIPRAAFATPWAGQHTGSTEPEPTSDAEQQQRRRLDNWLDVLAKILADEFILAPADQDPPEQSAPEQSAPEQSAPEQSTATAALPASARRRQGSKNSREAPGPFRIGSAKDLHATYRLHGDSTTLGYNIALLTTDAFVHQIRAFTGARADGDTPVLLLADQLAQTGHAPAKLIFDRAAGAPKRFAAVAHVTAGRTQLVAPLQRPGRRSACFAPDDFHLTQQDGATLLTCPAGQTTARAYRAGSGDGWHYRFLASQCSCVPLAPATTSAAGRPQGACLGRCPLWDKCRRADARPTSHRTVFVSDYLYQQQAAVAYLATPAFRRDMRHRANVERIIAALTRYNAVRCARSTGIAAANHQVRMAAVAFNLKTWHVRTQRQSHHPSRRSKEPPNAPA